MSPKPAKKKRETYAARKARKAEIEAESKRLSERASKFGEATQNDAWETIVRCGLSGGGILPVPPNFPKIWRAQKAWKRAMDPRTYGKTFIDAHGNKVEASTRNEPFRNKADYGIGGEWDWFWDEIDGQDLDGDRMRFLFGRYIQWENKPQGFKPKSVAVNKLGGVETYDVADFLANLGLASGEIDSYDDEREYTFDRAYKAITDALDAWEKFCNNPDSFRSEREIEEAEFDEEMAAGRAIEIEAALDADEKEIRNALFFVEGPNGHWRPFGRDRLSELKYGDLVSWDGETAKYPFLSYDKESGILRISDGTYDGAREFEITEEYAREITKRESEETNGEQSEEQPAEAAGGQDGDAEADRRQTEARPDDVRAGNAQGEPGRGEGRGAAAAKEAGGASAKQDDFALESVSNLQIAEEKRRRAEREEIEKRQNAPLTGNAGETGQTLLDLGGEEGEDLFNRTERSKQPADAQGNPLNADGSLKLDAVNSVDSLTDEDFTAPTRSVQLPKIPANIDAAIGADGKPVIIKRNIFARNAKRHGDLTPAQGRDIIKAALYSPDLYGQTQKRERPFSWVLLNIKGEDGKNRLVLLEVNQNKDNVEIVHWHFVDSRGVEKIKKQAAREDGQLLILPSAGAKEAGALSGPVGGSVSTTDNSLPQSGEKSSAEARPKTSISFRVGDIRLDSGVICKGVIPERGQSFTDADIAAINEAIAPHGLTASIGEAGKRTLVVKRQTKGGKGGYIAEFNKAEAEATAALDALNPAAAQTPAPTAAKEAPKTEQKPQAAPRTISFAKLRNEEQREAAASALERIDSLVADVEDGKITSGNATGRAKGIVAGYQKSVDAMLRRGASGVERGNLAGFDEAIKNVGNAKPVKAASSGAVRADVTASAAVARGKAAAGAREKLARILAAKTYDEFYDAMKSAGMYDHRDGAGESNDSLVDETETLWAAMNPKAGRAIMEERVGDDMQDAEAKAKAQGVIDMLAAGGMDEAAQRAEMERIVGRIARKDSGAVRFSRGDVSESVRRAFAEDPETNGWTIATEPSEIANLPPQTLAELPPVTERTDNNSVEKAMKRLFSDFGEVVNATSEERVIFNRADAGKMMMQSGIDMRRFSPHMKSLFEGAVPAWREKPVKIPGRHTDRNAVEFRHYVAKFEGFKDIQNGINGPAFVRFTVRIQNAGQHGVHAATVSVVSVIENNDASGTGPAQKLGGPTRIFVDSKLSKFLEPVKRESKTMPSRGDVSDDVREAFANDPETRNWTIATNPSVIANLPPQSLEVLPPVTERTDNNSVEKAMKQLFTDFGEVRNIESGERVVFNRADAGKMMMQSGADMRTLSPHLKALFENAVPAWSETPLDMPGHREHKDVVGYHNYVAKFIDANETENFVRFTVREQKSGRQGVHAATVSEVAIYKNAEGTSAPANKSGEASRIFVDKRLSKFLGKVKGNSRGWRCPFLPLRHPYPRRHPGSHGQHSAKNEIPSVYTPYGGD